MKLYLCNVGTSASQAILRDRRFLERHLPGNEPPPRLDAPLVRRLGGVAAAVQALSPFFLEFDHRDDEHLRKKLSAEVHSLVRCEVSSADRVVLLYSDTDDGEVSARVVEDYLRRRVGLGEDNVACQRVVGLQVNDATRFRREGVPNYFRLVLQEGERCGWRNVVLNPTGGYKALVSYATLLGMFFGVPVCYIFDNGQELLQLPPLPVEIDRARLLPLMPAMERIERETDIPAAEFWGKTPYDLRQLYDSLLEDLGGGRVTLSPIGLLVFERLRAARASQPLAVYLSRPAWEDFCHAPTDWDVTGFLQRLRTAGDIDRYRHPLQDGTLWLKPGNTSDRYRVELVGDHLLVYRILPHDEYERAAGRHWSRSQYAPFTRFDLVE
jgi:putative CRISPR-associated protein (TIGR02619 family)